MMCIPSGMLRTGSDKHYSEEATVHRATVSAPVTTRQFKQFFRATGDKTFAVRALSICELGSGK
jgi:formylglycine-generating enzyme required for sulfatase activity